MARLQLRCAAVMVAVVTVVVVPMLDWQKISVAVIVLAAFLYVARRAAVRLWSFFAPRGDDRGGSCTPGCGSCSGATTRRDAAAPAIETFVQINRRPPPPSPTARHSSR